MNLLCQVTIAENFLISVSQVDHCLKKTHQALINLKMENYYTENFYAPQFGLFNKRKNFLISSLSDGNLPYIINSHRTWCNISNYFEFLNNS